MLKMLVMRLILNLMKHRRSKNYLKDIFIWMNWPLSNLFIQGESFMSIEKNLKLCSADMIVEMRILELFY